MPKAAKPVKAQKAQKAVSKPASKQIAKQEVSGISKGARSGVVKEYNVLVGQGSITAQGEAEPVLVMFNCLVQGPDKKYPVLYPGDEVQCEIEERKNRRNLLGEEFGPGKLAINVRLVKAVPRPPVYRRVHTY